MVKKEKIAILFLIILTSLLVIADQLSKFFARHMTESVPIIKNIFHLTFVMNFGIAFGLLQGYNHIVVWLYLVVLGMIIFFYDRFPQDRFSRIMLFFIIAGIIGNFIDRIVLGYVTDFFDFRIWPVFNLADLFLNIGIIGIIAKELLNTKKINAKK